MIQNDVYHNYFKHQYISHPDLGNGDETGFEYVSLEEALGEYRRDISSDKIIMRLSMYTYAPNDNEAADAQKLCQGAFVLLKNFSLRSGNKAAYYAAMAATEKVVDEIIEKMLADSRNDHPLFHNSLNTAKNIFVSPREFEGDGKCGWIVSLRFTTWFRNCITDPAAPAWLDGGETPHEL